MNSFLLHKLQGWGKVDDFSWQSFLYGASNYSCDEYIDLTIIGNVTHIL